MLWGVGIVFTLVLVNAFFVAAEYALVRVRRTRMEALAAQGSSLAKVVLHGLHHINRYIAGVQVGITLAGLASGRFGEPALAALFDPLLARLFPPALIGTEASTALATGFTLIVIRRQAGTCASWSALRSWSQRLCPWTSCCAPFSNVTRKSRLWSTSMAASRG